MKTIQVNLQFNADTKTAKAQIKTLQQELNNAINSGTMGKLGATTQIQEATRSAMDLKIALKNATNVDTGKLNLTKFQSELNRSGKNIQQYAQQLKMLGPSGVKAFNQLAEAVASANTRLINLSGGFKKLTNTFFNTLRWSMTSAAISGVTTAISNTVNYAKELDTSLNNIRIVTGKSADEMARFAKEANKMAKELATTTTKYTDATLIYYQQGLSSKEVAERTKTTVKLANVVGESAQTVSEWMTAIWNNFDDGSKSLEYYADVLAKLGAATASSADEIAGGLEKFAAVADTIGLSYEYAASMLATITAETRQSEDVVGTALKTILSRMEQLNQGKVLEDGTSLGKYSLALQKVGVDIKTTSGELKDMDLILAETGKRWDTLARDQQIALAQSVAGIRQYTQFMALMDNWDVMEKNLAMTKSANGALQEQQEIYEDSIQAAENRMKVAGEKVKSTLLNEKDLKGLYNFAGGALDVIAEMLEAFGGLPTILLAVAAALTKVYQPQVASFFSQMAIAGKDMMTTLRHPIKAIRGENETQAKSFQSQVFDEAKLLSETTGATPGETEVNKKMASIHTTLAEKSQEMTASAKQRAAWELEILESMREEVSLMAKGAEEATTKTQRKRMTMEESFSESHGSGMAEQFGQVSDQAVWAGKLDARMRMMNTVALNNSDVNLTPNGKKEMGQILSKQLQGAQTAANGMGLDLSTIEAELDGSMVGFGELQAAISAFAEKGEGDINRLIEVIARLKVAVQEAADKKLNAGIDQTMSWAGESSPEDIEGMKQKEAAQQKNIDTINNANLQESGTGLDVKNTEKVLDSLDTGAMGKGGKGQVTKWKNELKEIKKLKKGTKEYDDAVASLNKKIKNSTKETTKHTGVLKKELKQTNANRKAAEKKTKGLEGLREETQGQIKDTRAAAEAEEGAAIGMEALGEQADKLDGKLKKNGFRHWSDTLASGVSTMATYAMGLSMMQGAFENLFTAIGNGDLTVGDFISSLASVLMSVSMVIPSIMAMTKAYRDSANAKREAAIAAEKEVWANKMGITVDQLDILMEKKKRGEVDKSLAQDKQVQLSNAMTAISGVAEQAGQGPKGWITAAISLAMIIPMLAMAGIGIAGGIGASKQSESEAAAEEEEALKGQASDKKQEFDDFKSAIKDYKEAQENIDKLVEGTDEWTQAIIEVNSEIVDLISKYKDLAQFVDTAENGRMTIRDEGWTYISNKLAKEVAMTNTIAQGASIRTEKAKIEEKRDKVLDIQGLNESELDTIITKFKIDGEKTFLGLEEQLKALGVDSDDAAEKIKQYCRELNNLNNSEALLMKTRMNSILTSEFGFNSNTLTAGVQALMSKVGQKALDDAEEDFSEEAIKAPSTNWWGAVTDILSLSTSAWLWGKESIDTKNKYVRDSGWSYVATDEGQQAFENYVQAMGLEIKEDSVDFKKNKIVYEVNGSDDTSEVSYKTLLDYEKQAYLEARSSKFADMAMEISDTSRELLGSDSAVDQAIGEYLKSGNISALSVDAFDALKEAQASGGIAMALTESAKGVEILKEIGINAEELGKELAMQLDGLSRNEVIANIIQRDQRTYEDTLSSGASSLGMKDSNALEAYAEHLAATKKGLDDTKTASAEVAVEHFKLAKGLVGLRKALSDNIDTLNSASENSLEYAEAIGSIKTAIDKAFGSDVSFDFIKTNLTEIQNMLAGSVEDYNKVRKALVKDWVKNLELDEESVQEISTLFDQLMDKVNNGATEITIDANNTAAIQKINDLVAKGLIAESELEAAFRNANLEWGANSTFRYYDLPQGTTTNSVVKGKYGDTEFEYTTETYNESTTRLPWIGDNPPQFKAFSTNAKAESAASALYANGDKYSYTDEAGNEQVFNTQEEFLADYKENGLGRAYKVVGTGVNTEEFTINSKPTYVDSSVLTYDEQKNETASDKKERLKDLDDEIERYHEIDETLSVIEKDLKQIQRYKERAFGADRLAAIQNEINKEKELGEVEKERLAQAENYLNNVDRPALLDNYAVELDADGNITNYNALIQEQIDKLKSMDPIADKDRYEEAENYLEQMKNDFSDYEDSLKEVRDQQEAVADNQDRLYELAMEEIEYKVQIQVDISSDDQQYIDFLMQKYEDNEFEAAIKIQYAGQSVQNTLNDIDAIQKGIDETYAKLEKGEITDAQAAELIRGYNAELADKAANLLKQEAAVWEYLNAEYDAWNEKFDKNAEKLEHLVSMTESYKNIIDIVGKDNLGISDEIMRKMSETQVEIANNQLKAADAKLKANEAYLKELKETREKRENEGADDEELAKWDEQIEYAEEQVRAASEEFMGSWENALQVAADAFAEHIDQITEKFSEAMGGIYKNLKELQEGFNRAAEEDDWYLEEYEKTYEISKLNRKIQQDISKSNSLKAKNELTQLSKELLEMEKESVNVSKWDLEWMQKKYDLMLAEQALEDAKNNKSTVKLRRDSEGNFGYVYTADQSKVDSAQQTYEDRLYDMQKYSDETLRELDETIIQINQEFQEALNEIANDTTLSFEEKKKKTEEITAFYTRKLQFYTSEAEDFLYRGSEMNSKYNTTMADSFHDSIIGRMYSDMESYHDLFVGSQRAMQTAADETAGAIEVYQSRIDTAMDLAGTSVSTFADKVANPEDGYLTRAAAAAKSVADKAGEIKEAMHEALNGPDGAINAVSTFQSNFAEEMGKIREEIRLTIEANNKWLEENSKATPLNLDKATFGNAKAMYTKKTSEMQDKNKHATVNSSGEKQTGSSDQIGDKLKGETSYQVESYTHDDGKTYYRVNDGKGYVYMDQTAYDNSFTSTKPGNTTTKDNTTTKGGTTTKDNTTTKQMRLIYWEGRGGNEDMFLSDDGYWYTHTALGLTQPEAAQAARNKSVITVKANVQPTKKAVKISMKKYIPAVGNYNLMSDGSIRGYEGLITLSGNKVKLGTMEEGNWYYADYDNNYMQQYKIGDKVKQRLNASALAWYREAPNSFRPDTWGPFKSAYQPNLIDGAVIKDVEGKGTASASLMYYVWNSKKQKGLWLSTDRFEKFDTGGYTGSWGPEGRMAMLHQKEIILNAHDTENFLTAINIVRDISDQLEKNALTMQYRNNLNQFNTALKDTHKTLEQNVTIHAEFPNATNHSEIEEAFSNLVNLAAQHINRNY